MLVPLEVMSTLFGMSGNASMGGMSMTLHIGDREFILFTFWKTGSPLGLAASILIIFLMCILYEAIKALRIFVAVTRTSNRIRDRQRRGANSPIRASSEGAESIESDSVVFAPLLRISSAAVHVFTTYRVMHALLYAAQSTLAYLLMLVVMTFNVWLLLAVVFGEAVGYFLFAGDLTIPEQLSDACC